MDFVNNNIYRLKMESVQRKKEKEEEEKKSEELRGEENTEPKTKEAPKEKPVTLRAEDALAIVNRAMIKGALKTDKPKDKGRGGDNTLEDLIAEWNSLSENATYEEKLNLLNSIIDACGNDEEAARIWKCRRVLVMSEQAYSYTKGVLSNDNWEGFDFAEFQRTFNSYLDALEFYDIRGYYLSNFYNGELSYDEQVTFANAGLKFYSAMLGFYQIMQHNPGIEPGHYNNQIEQMQNGVNVYIGLIGDIPEQEEQGGLEEPTAPTNNPWDGLVASWNSLPEDADYDTKINLLNQIIETIGDNEDEARIWRCRRVLVMSRQAYSYAREILSNDNWEGFNFAEFQRTFNSYFDAYEFTQIKDHYLSNFSELSYDEQVTFTNAGINLYSAQLAFYQILQHKPGITQQQYDGYQNVIDQSLQSIAMYQRLQLSIPEPEEPENHEVPGGTGGPNGPENPGGPNGPEPPTPPTPPESPVTPTPGQTIIPTVQDFDSLVDQWNALTGDEEYSDKDGLMLQIIEAAESNASEYEPDSEEYQYWIDQANEWRCYRFIMRNNYRQQMYEQIRQQLNNGTLSYEDIFNNFEDIPNEWQHLYIDMSRNFWYEDEEDFRTTNPVYDENGNLTGYEYDNQGFQYFGGKTVKVSEGQYGYIYVPNEDPQKRFLYNEAMIASYKVKILAVQIKLHDPALSSNSNARAKLNSDLRDYQRLLQGLLAEQKNLAVELGYMTSSQTNWGTTTYQWVDPNHGLVPGLTPPAQTPNPPLVNPYLSDEFYSDYMELKAQYKGMSGASAQAQIAILNQLLEYATEGYNGDHVPDATFWQSEMLHWQRILNSLNSGSTSIG